MSKDIINLTKSALAKDIDARKARWELGNALLATFFTKDGRDWVRNTSIDKDARTVKDEAIANAKKVKKSAKALEVFYGEAIRFAKKHKTVESAMNNTIKGKKKPAQPKRFSAKRDAVSLIDRFGEKNAESLAWAILASLGVK